MKRLLPLAMLLAMLFSALPLNAALADGPAPVVDQEFVSPAGASLTFPDGPNIYVAQTFTAGVTGMLTAVNLGFTTTIPADVSMSLEIFGVTNGAPNNTMYSQRFLEQEDLSAMNADPLSYNIPVPGFVVTAGQQYAIEVHYTAVRNGSAVHSVWSGATGDHYTGGSVFIGTSFESWTPAAAGLDLHFRTYVVTGPVSDLKIVRVSGPKKAHACQVFKETYRVTNLGPDAATRVSVGIGGGDQFSGVSVNGVPTSEPYYFDLAAGQTKTIIAYFKVVAFVPGETRDAFIGASVSSDIYPDIAIDPNPDNNNVGTSIWLVGKPRLTCP